MNDILRPITPDGKVGFDQYNKLVWKRQEASSLDDSSLSHRALRGA